MKNIEITRLYQTPFERPKQTEGVLHICEDNHIVYTCHTLELPWLDNKQRVSCIPNGTYKVVKHVSPHLGNCFHILDVKGRENILIHSGNYHTDVLGCILVGDRSVDINNDGLRDVLNSKKTLSKLLSLMPNEFELTIRWR